MATVLTLAAPRTQGQATEDWTRTLTSATGQLYGAMAAVDRHDALYVTGSDPGYQIVTAKLSPAGLVLWQRTFNAPGERDQAAWLAVDPFDDVVVAGYSVVGASRTPNGFVTLKYDPAGNLLWSDVMPSTWGSLARVATDANGDVVVLGRDWNNGIVTIKYSRGGTRLWTRTASLTPFNQNFVGALALDPAGNVYVTGGMLGTLLTLSYDAAGTLRWSRTLAAAGSGADLVLDAAGAVYVTGAASGSAGDRTLVVKFDATGNLQWNHSYPGLTGHRIAVDGHDDVVVAASITTGGYRDWITHKLDPSGTLRWSATYDRHRYNDEVPYGIAIGPDDEVYVTGQGGPGPTSGELSYLRAVTVRYARSGVEEWAVGSFTSLRGRGVVRLSDNTIATVGESTFTVFHYTQSGVWRSLGSPLLGSAGLPHLEGTGSPRGNATVSLELGRSLPGAPAWLIAGVTRVNQPFLGGLLVPAPHAIVGGFTVLPNGTLSLPFAWPAGLPPAFELSLQFWIADPTAPFGFAASNGLVGVSQ